MRAAICAAGLTFQLTMTSFAQIPYHKQRVELTSPRAEYLLGEPVVLKVTVTNLSDRDLSLPQTFFENSQPEIPTYINGERFYWPYPISCGQLNPVVLKRDESWMYWLRAGYGVLESERDTRPVPFHLAFPKPGSYEVKTGSGREHYHVYNYRSNTIKVTIKEPSGDDAVVWRRLQVDNLYTGLQSAYGISGKYALRVVKLLEEFPTTGYADTLRSALRRGYCHKRSELTPAEQATMRKLTGVTDVAEFKDPRLDAKFQIRIERMKNVRVHDSSVGLTLETLLEELRDQGGLTFDASAYLKRRHVALWKVDVPGWGLAPRTIRDCMGQEFVTDRLQAWWVKRGDGYTLVHEEELAGKSTP